MLDARARHDEEMTMMSIRIAVTDDDLESWREVRMAVAPGERAASVEEMRAMENAGRQLLLAEADGKVVGSGLSDASSLGGGFVVPRVVPDARRRGVGTALLLALAEHSASQGHASVFSSVDDESTLAFASRFGFEEVDREIEQRRAVGEEPAPVLPSGIRIDSVAEVPELWERAYYDVHETFADMAHVAALEVSLDEWKSEWINAPEAAFVARHDDQVVGVASLLLDHDHPTRAEHGYTGVRREWRGRGVAGALKRSTLAWAAEHGIEEIYTWTQTGNDAMRAVNEHLGYRYGEVSIRLRAPLPLNLRT
jgi:mycothiol synthase